MKRISQVLGLVLIGATFIGGCESGREWNPPPGFVVGTVSDKDSGLPIDSAIVSARLGPDTTYALLSKEASDTSGYYRLFAGYYEGDVFVFAEKEGFAPDTQNAYLRKHDTVKVNFELESR